MDWHGYYDHPGFALQGDVDTDVDTPEDDVCLDCGRDGDELEDIGNGRCRRCTTDVERLMLMCVRVRQAWADKHAALYSEGGLRRDTHLVLLAESWAQDMAGVNHWLRLQQRTTRNEPDWTEYFDRRQRAMQRCGRALARMQDLHARVYA